MSQVDRGRKKCLEGKKQKNILFLLINSQKEGILYRKFSNTGGSHNTRNQLLVFLKKIELSRFMIIEVHNS